MVSTSAWNKVPLPHPCSNDVSLYRREVYVEDGVSPDLFFGSWCFLLKVCFSHVVLFSGQFGHAS